MEQAQIPTGMLLQKAVKVRTDILEMVAEAKSGHPGGSLSAVEVLVSLFFYKMRHDPKRPDWPDRDRFVLSKGHAAPVLFATLAESGYFPVSELKTLRKLNSRLQDIRTLGFRASISPEALSGSDSQRPSAWHWRESSTGRATGSTLFWETVRWTRARHGRRPWRLPSLSWTISLLSLIVM